MQFFYSNLFFDNSTHKGQPRNRLSFFYADEQKGATNYDETEKENPRGLAARIEETQKKIPGPSRLAADGRVWYHKAIQLTDRQGEGTI